MECNKSMFAKFEEGCLRLPEGEISFDALPWSPHPAFEGVKLKTVVSSETSGGQFSFHLVRIAPHKKIGLHVHEKQIETHEVLEGTGVCVSGGVELQYKPGVVSIFPMNIMHEVTAGAEGLCLFAKFFPGT